MTDIALNLKGIVCRMHSDATEVEAPPVQVLGLGQITAKDIDLPAGVEILNPEVHIATLEKKTKLELYMTIGRGRAAIARQRRTSRPTSDWRDPDRFDLLAGSAGRPMRSRARASAQKTDFDKLTLDIETDGSIDPQAALREAAELLIATAGDLHRRRPYPGAAGGAGWTAQGHGLRSAVVGGSPAAWRARSGHPDRGAGAWRALVQLPEKRAGIQTVGDLISKLEAELELI